MQAYLFFNSPERTVGRFSIFFLSFIAKPDRENVLLCTHERIRDKNVRFGDNKKGMNIIMKILRFRLE